MVEYHEPKSPISVSALLDEIEAGFSPGGTTMKRKNRESNKGREPLKLQIDIPDQTTHADGAGITRQVDLISHELSILMCDVTSGMEGAEEPAKSQNEDMVPSSRISSRGSSLWSGSHSSSSAYSGSTDRSISSQDSKLFGGLHEQVERHQSRALPLQPTEVYLSCNDESINDDDLDEEYNLQQARLMSMQAPELALRSNPNNSAVDFDEEYELQEARALSLQPRDVMCGLSESMVDFDEEFDFEEARALSMQPREIVMTMNDSVDFDEEFDIQEARALSMQPSEFFIA